MFDDVAVIIPTWNRAESTARAIGSVLDQEPAPTEVMVVDDGSTDDTPERLRAFGDRIVVHRQANAGVSAARNAGIERTRSPFVVFLDSDDRLLPGAIAAGIAAAADGADAAMFSARDAVTGAYATKPLPGERYTLRGLLGPDEAFALPCGLFRREVLQTVGGFDTSLPITQDYLLLLDALVYGFDVRVIREPFFLKDEDHDPARLSATIEGNMRGKLAALDRFAERHPQEARAQRHRMRRLRARYLARLGRTLATQASGDREATACLGASALRRPLRLDVVAEWCASAIAPAAYRRHRRRRQERGQRA